MTDPTDQLATAVNRRAYDDQSWVLWVANFMGRVMDAVLPTGGTDHE